MKQLIATTLFSTILFGQSATITVNNITGDGQDLAFSDSSSSLLTSGFISLYSFDSGSVPSTAAELHANGVTGLLGVTATFNSTTNNNSADPGSFTRSFSDITNNSVLDVYLVIGNGTDVNSSTELALLNTLLQLDGEDTGPTGDSLAYNAKGSPAELVIGTVDRDEIDWGETVGSAYTTNVLSLEAVSVIPEPSSLVLSGLAALAFAGRRTRG